MCVIRDVKTVSAIYCAYYLHAKVAAILDLRAKPVTLLCIEFPYTSVTARGQSTATQGLMMKQLVARFINLIALRFPELKRLAGFLQNSQMKVARFTVLQPGRLYPQEIYPDTHFC